VKRNGKHRLHKAGKVDVSVDVSNGKVVALTAAHPTKGNLQVRKVKLRQKLADTQPAVDPDQHANGSGCRWYYGWWFVDDEEDDWYYWYYWYYWFTADVVIVDETWIVYG
jgi:hypothetical protein